MKRFLLNPKKMKMFKTAFITALIGCSVSVTAQCDSPMTINIPDVSDECGILVYAPESMDDCDGMITGTTSDPVTYSTIGSYVINWEFTDNDFNTYYGTQNVYVTDTQDPMPDEPSLEGLTGQCEVTVTSTPSAFDMCSGFLYGTTTDPLYYSTPGSYTITWKYDDGHGNVIYQTQSVNISDDTPPVADEASLPTLYGACSVTTSAIPTATDNCAGAISATTSDPLTYNTAGTYVITWSYDDNHGNAFLQNQTVVVTNVAPIADETSLDDITGICSITVTEVPTATDDCIGAVDGTTSDPLTYNIPGSYVITWSFSDGVNTSTQTQNVILDTINTETYLASYGTVISSYYQSGATYQWLDCNNGNSAISGEIEGFYIPTNSGNYAVEITVGSCIDTSACVSFIGVGINENTKQEVSIYPNPTSGIFNINLGTASGLTNYTISTLDGKIVVEGKTTENTISIDLQNKSNGVYFLKINGENTINTYKVIKQ